MGPLTRRWVPVLVMAALVLAGCGREADSPPEAAAEAPPDTTTSTMAPGVSTTEVADPGGAGAANGVAARPSWLGTRPLPLRPDGYGEVQPTPPELRDRRLATIDVLDPPVDAAFASSVGPVPPAVTARSTWEPACPVGLDDLRHVTVSFWGFDDRPHTGELLVHADVADDVVGAFRRLHQARFPIEEMRITRLDELGAHPTGDANNTGAFVCRPSRGTTSWSEHAYGRALDINPFHNPYVKGDLVLPELASAYIDRSTPRPGMIFADGVATAAFADIGWGWGGTWRSNQDYMHFSANGR